MIEPFKIKAKLLAAQVVRIVLNQAVRKYRGLYNGCSRVAFRRKYSRD